MLNYSNECLNHAQNKNTFHCIFTLFLIGMLSTLFILISNDVIAFDLDSVRRNHPNMKGKVLKSRAFIDKMGENYIYLNSTGNYRSHHPSDGDVCSNIDIFAYAYRGDSYTEPTLLWKMNDFVHDCIASAECQFSEDSPIITDLNQNGIKEVWLITYLGCRGDVSPLGMKILMYEDGKKYALRGETFIHVDGMDLGGNYKKDQAFANGPKEFLKFADKLWNMHKNF